MIFRKEKKRIVFDHASRAEIFLSITDFSRRVVLVDRLLLQEHV